MVLADVAFCVQTYSSISPVTSDSAMACQLTYPRPPLVFSDLEPSLALPSARAYSSLRGRRKAAPVSMDSVSCPRTERVRALLAVRDRATRTQIEARRSPRQAIRSTRLGRLRTDRFSAKLESETSCLQSGESGECDFAHVRSFVRKAASEFLCTRDSIQSKVPRLISCSNMFATSSTRRFAVI